MSHYDFPRAPYDTGAMGRALATEVSKLTKVAEGREAEMFAWEDGKILRLFRGDFLRSTIEYQTNVLSTIAAAGIRVPRVYETIEVDGRTGVVMERIPGVDLLTRIGGKPWTVWSAGRIAGKAQAQINETTAPTSLPTTLERYAAIIEQSDAVPEAYRAPTLARLGELPDGDRLLHGDLHPANIMMAGDEPVIIDWSNASRGNPEADIVRSLMILRLGDPPPGTSPVIRVAAGFARSILLNAHMKSYRRARRPDEALMRAWELPVAVARLGEGIEAERPKLLRLVDRLLNDTRSP